MVNTQIDKTGGVNLHKLLEAIQRDTEFDHPVEKYELLETHISFILLTGPYAYKFKKHINLGFLDFGTLEKRKRYCDAEVRLNRRTAPELYLGVVAFTGEVERPVLGGDAVVLEYAVKMLQFPKRTELIHVLEDGRLLPVHVDLLAQKIAKFHQAASVIPEYHPSGTIRSIEKQSLDNLNYIRPVVSENTEIYRNVEFLREWTLARLNQLDWQFRLRKQQGFVRDCHGDLHLRNIVLADAEPHVFDCVEFSDELRQIDVISDIAFLLMDLEMRNEKELAWRFLNNYLQLTGDYSGLVLLRFYKVYRALTRAKVDCIRLQQAELSRSDKEEQWLELYRNIDLAWRYTQPQGPALIITHGMAGSGKSWFSRQLPEQLGAVRICSDVERKRLHYLPSDARTHSAPGKGIYTVEHSVQSYEHMAGLAKTVLAAGYIVIIDATFLKLEQRREFRQLASTVGVPFIIIDFQANEEILRSRIKKRSESGDDVSEASLDVLEYQFKLAEPLTRDEIQQCVVVDADSNASVINIMAQIKKRMSG